MSMLRALLSDYPTPLARISELTYYHVDSPCRCCLCCLGGLRSTFIADYLHTVVLIIAIFVFSFLLYASGDAAGSPEKLYNLLVAAAIARPAASANGSYLSFKSVEGLILSMDLLIGGIGTVWLDQAYWQRAIALPTRN